MNDKNKILSMVSIYHALNDGSVSVIPILFPIFKSLFNLSYTQVGIITGGGMLINIVVQLMIGRTSDGKNFRTMLSIGIFLVILSMFLLTRSQDFLSLMLFVFILRFSSSFFHPIGIGLVSRIFKRDRLDWAMGIQSGSANIGSFLAIATTLYVAEITSWNFPLQLWSMTGAIVLLIGIVLTRNIGKEYFIVKKINKKQSFKESLNESFDLLKKIKMLIPAFIISGSAWGVIITYLPLLLNERTTLSLPNIGFLIAVWVGIGSISSFFYGRINSIIGRKNVILISYLTIGITGIFLIFFTNILIYLAIMILLGLTVFLTYPALSSFISEITHESAEGKTFGIVFTLQLGSGFLLLLIGGILSDIIGVWVPFAILSALSIIFTMVLLVNYKKPIISPA